MSDSDARSSKLLDSDEDEDFQDADEDMDASSLVYLSDEAERGSSVEDMEDSAPVVIDSSPDVSIDGDNVPLVPTGFASVIEAAESFNTIFASRYGDNFAPFFRGSLQDALTEAFDAPDRDATDRRPLAMYLHKDSSKHSNNFAQNVICSDSVSSLLRRQFVTWAWDMSKKENREKLHGWIAEASMAHVSDLLKQMNTSKYPLILVLVKNRDAVLPMVLIRGRSNVEDSVDKLLTGLDTFVQLKNRYIAREQRAEDNKRIRLEQHQEYEKALAADRAKKEAMEKQLELEKEEAIKKERLKAEKLARQMQIASTLPDEPAATDQNTIVICVRSPSGDQNTRRFRKDAPLNWLIAYVESLGFEIEQHRVWTSDIPKKDVSTFDSSKSFAELNWPRREKIVIEEK